MQGMKYLGCQDTAMPDRLFCGWPRTHYETYLYILRLLKIFIQWFNYLFILLNWWTNSTNPFTNSDEINLCLTSINSPLRLMTNKNATGPYRVRAGTGWPGASILWLGEVESWICNFYLSVAARKIVWADPSLRYTSMLLGHKASNQPTNHLLHGVTETLYRTEIQGQENWTENIYTVRCDQHSFLQPAISQLPRSHHCFQGSGPQWCISHGWEWTILVLLKNKKISSRGPLSWRNSMFVSCVCKRRWWLDGRKCRKMPESDICVCRKAKVVELHIIYTLK